MTDTDDYIPAYGAVRDAVSAQLAAQGQQIAATAQTSADAAQTASSAAQAAVSAFVGIATPKVVSAGYTASSGEVIEADTSAGSWTLYLPTGGGIVILRDHAQSWGTNPLTINGNGALIDGAATWAADATGFELTFTRVGNAWRYTLAYLIGG